MSFHPEIPYATGQHRSERALSPEGEPFAFTPAQRATFEAVRRALEDGWHRPGVSHWAVVSDAMNEAVRRILQGGEPVRPAKRRALTVTELMRRPSSPARLAMLYIHVPWRSP